jgi:hypothetical protein
MTMRLRYGFDAEVPLEWAPGAVVTHCNAPHGEPLVDVAAATNAALAAPLEYPPLSRAVVADDRVTITLAGQVPGAASVVGAAVNALLTAGLAPSDLTLLGAAAAGDPQQLLADVSLEAARGLTCLVHDPSDRAAHSYLAALADGTPIYLHRALPAADLVVALGTLQLPEAAGYWGVGGCVFPEFADAQTRSALGGTADPTPRRRKQATEAIWLLGASLTVQVVPGRPGEVLHVVAGSFEAVRRRGEELCRRAWRFDLPHRGALVVAAIEGGPAEQTWDAAGRALAAALAAGASDADVVLCSDLQAPPGPALKRLIRATDAPRALRGAARSGAADALFAEQLARALDRGRVYLLSRLDDSLVEACGAVPLGSAAEVARLTRRYQSCVVLSNADRGLAVARAD